MVGSVYGWAAEDSVLEHRFSTRVLQEVLKHAVADYLVRGTGPFSLRLSNKNMTTANTTINRPM